MCLCRGAVIVFSFFLIPLINIQAEKSLADPAKLDLNKFPLLIEANFSDVKKPAIAEVLNPDLMMNHTRRKRYALYGIGLPKTNLTWSLVNQHISDRDAVRAIIKEATTYWSNHSVLTFTETSAFMDADIRIEFDNGDFFPSNDVAHTFQPKNMNQGLILLNSKVSWSHRNKSDSNANSLSVVIAHELGHALGILHSNDPKSIMTLRYDNNFNLTAPMPDDDLVAINKIYGIQEKELPNICTAKYDAVSVKNNGLVIFVGNYIYFTESNELKLISDVYNWLPHNQKVDAYYSDSRGYEYFILGKSVLVFDSVKLKYFVKHLRSIGVFLKYDHVDAVFKYNGKIFMVSGEQYWNIDEDWNSVMGQGNMYDFESISLPITTAFESLNGTTYIVKGTRYWPLNTQQALLPEEQHRTKDLVCSSQKSNSKQPKCCTAQSTDQLAEYDPNTLFQFYSRKEDKVGINICKSKLDTVSVVNDDLVIFVGEYMYSRALNEFMLIRDAYKWLPESLTEVDGYYFDPKGYEYFFIGTEIYKFYQGELISLRSENLTSIGLNSTIEDIDAVFKYNSSIIIVSDRKYWTFNDDWNMVEGPASITRFSLLMRISTAFGELGRMIYFVFDDEYALYDVDEQSLNLHLDPTGHLVCSLRKKNILNPKCCTFSKYG